MYNLIVCGYDFQRTMEIINGEKEKAIEMRDDFEASFVMDGNQLMIPITVHIRTGEKVAYSKILKGHADRIMSATAEAAIRNLEWLKQGGVVTVEEKPGLPYEDEQYPVSVMIDYIVKTT